VRRWRGGPFLIPRLFVPNPPHDSFPIPRGYVPIPTALFPIPRKRNRGGKVLPFLFPR